MIQSRFLPIAFFLLLPVHAQALIITDTISVNETLGISSHRFEFDLTKQGYNYRTDTINSVSLSYDFSNMIDEIDDFDNYDTLETIQLNSYLFDGRSNFHDIDPEIIYQHIHWTRDLSYCQHENYDNGECEYHLDLNGTAREFLGIYNGNLWLGDVTFSVDVTRINLPEPTPFILFGIGLMLALVTPKAARHRYADRLL